MQYITLTEEFLSFISSLSQTAVSGSERTVWEEARSRMTDLLEAEAMLDRAGEGRLDV